MGILRSHWVCNADVLLSTLSLRWFMCAVVVVVVVAYVALSFNYYDIWIDEKAYDDKHMIKYEHNSCSYRMAY